MFGYGVRFFTADMLDDFNFLDEICFAAVALFCGIEEFFR